MTVLICVSLMIDESYNVKEVQKWIGHTDAETTLNIYAKIKESRKTYIGNNLETIFVQNT